MVVKRGRYGSHKKAQIHSKGNREGNAGSVSARSHQKLCHSEKNQSNRLHVARRTDDCWGVKVLEIRL